jgi:hypothetical protein
MPNVVSAVVTNAWRAQLAQNFLISGATTFAKPSYFRIGEGGSSGGFPVTPSVTATSIVATGSPLYFFQKSFISSDVTFTGPTRLSIRCFVAASEANLNVSSLPPQFYEVGVFDSNGTLMVYSTFPVEIKTASKSLEHYILVDF